MKYRAGALLAASAGLIITTGLLAGCGTDVSGAPAPAQPDLSQLDVGNYPTTPRTVGNAKTRKQASARESQRLADYVVLPFEVDPAYVIDNWMLRPHVVLNQKGFGNLVINDTFDSVAKDLEAGWVNSWTTAADPAGKTRKLSVSVMQFPTAETAREVGPLLEHDDSTYNRDNEPVSIGRPNTNAHWRPSVNSIGSWTVKDRFVIFMKIDDETGAPDLSALTHSVEQVLDAQLPLLDQYKPTPAAELNRIPLDPEGLLGRTIPSDPGKLVRADVDGTYTSRGIMSLLASPTQETLDDMRQFDIDLVSFGQTVVFRSRSERASQAMWDKWKPSMNLNNTDQIEEKIVASPTGITGQVECHEQSGKSGGEAMKLQTFCTFQSGRYFVQVNGGSLQEIHQRLSAQYKLLVTN